MVFDISWIFIKQYSIVRPYHNLFTHLCVDGHLSCCSIFLLFLLCTSCFEDYFVCLFIISYCTYSWCQVIQHHLTAKVLFLANVRTETFSTQCTSFWTNVCFNFKRVEFLGCMFNCKKLPGCSPKWLCTLCMRILVALHSAPNLVFQFS